MRAAHTPRAPPHVPTLYSRTRTADRSAVALRSRAPTGRTPRFRYGGCSPLLRISSSLLQSEALVKAFVQRGMERVLVDLLHAVIGFAVSSLMLIGNSSMQASRPPWQSVAIRCNQC